MTEHGIDHLNPGTRTASAGPEELAALKTGIAGKGRELSDFQAPMVLNRLTGLLDPVC
jgi:hypothetical protein